PRQRERGRPRPRPLPRPDGSDGRHLDAADIGEEWVQHDPPAAGGRSGRRNGTRMTRILVVDDEPQILRALRINLTARQYAVTTAPNGSRALESVRTEHPDIVVLDLGLPDLDGIDVIHNLRSWTPVPIVVLSGRVGSHDKVDALDAGADDYVTKPFNIDELLA